MESIIEQPSTEALIVGVSEPEVKIEELLKSPVWAHFNRHCDSRGVFLGISDCKYCHKIFTGVTGTSTLRKHVLNHCSKVPIEERETLKGTVGKSTQTILQFSGKDVSNWKFDQGVCRRSLVRMIILCEFPFSIVEKEGFREFLQDLQPRFSVVSRFTVARDCFKMYTEEKLKLKEYFKNSSTRVCLTTDLWTSIQNLGYMCLTAHYVDDEWKLQKRIICFHVLPHPHKGDVIAKALELCLLKWGLGKVSTITLDNASSNDTCVDKLKERLNKRDMLLLDGEFLHVRCFAHIINLVVESGLKDVQMSVKRLRRSVKYVRSSPSRLQTFNKFVLEEGIKCKMSVCLDVKTRWNSTFHMIQSVLDYKQAFYKMEEDPCFVEAVTRMDKKEKVLLGLLAESDWRSSNNLHVFLKQFYTSTRRISGSRYITSNTYFFELSNTKDLIMEYLETEKESSAFHVMAMRMNAKFDKYCDLAHLNPILLVAIVLDPRYKIQYVEFWYAEQFDKDVSLETQDAKEKKLRDFVYNLKELMANLYRRYKIENRNYLDVSMDSNVDDSGGLEAIERPAKRARTQSKFSNYLRNKESVEVMNDLDRYLQDDCEEMVQPFDVLAWWKGKCATYWSLALMARDILAISVTSIASECAFSAARRVLDQFRSCLTPKTVESLICTQDWIRKPKTPINIEDTIDKLDEIDEDVIMEFEME